MDEIKIYDNFLNKLEVKFFEKILNNNKWEFGHMSENNGFDCKFWYMELINDETAYKFIKNKIEENLKKKISIDRLYANGQTFGLNGSYHKDTSNTSDDNLFTFCIYINDVPNDTLKHAGGNIQIKIPNKNFSISIEPLNGRGVLFPSNYTHKGNAFDRFFTGLRICIACKFVILE